MPVRTYTAGTLPMAKKTVAGQPFQGRALGRYANGEVFTSRPTMTPGVWSNYVGSIYDTAGTVVSPSASTPGFQRITESIDTTKVYVSSISGDDTRDGLTPETSVRSFVVGRNKLRSGFPDHLLIERGSELIINLSQDDFISGRSVSEPMVYGVYGSGARPVIKGEDVHIIYGFKTFIQFVGFEFYAHKLDPFSPTYNPHRFEVTGPNDHANLSFYGGHENIRFDDCVFNYCEVVAQLPSTATVSGPYYFNRCIFKNTYVNSSGFSQLSRPSGMFISYITGMYLNECVLDHNGWNEYVAGAGANMFNHNIYWQYYNDGDFMELTNCILSNASAHGMQMRAGGLSENCFVARCAIGITMGHGRHGPDGKYKGGVRVHSYNNVISEARTMRVGPAHCLGPSLCTSALWGYDIVINDPVYDAANPEHSNWDGTPSDYQVHNNIASMRAPASVDPEQANGVNVNALRFMINDGDTRMVHSGNVAYKFDTETQGTTAGYLDPDRTAGTFHQTLVGPTGSTEDWIETCAQRLFRNWDNNYSAVGVNDYIRAGFGMTRIAYTWP